MKGIYFICSDDISHKLKRDMKDFICVIFQKNTIISDGPGIHIKTNSKSLEYLLHLAKEKLAQYSKGIQRIYVYDQTLEIIHRWQNEKWQKLILS